MEVEVKEIECLKCGHKWIPRKPVVTVCPKCKVYTWNTPRKERAYD